MNTLRLVLAAGLVVCASALSQGPQPAEPPKTPTKEQTIYVPFDKLEEVFEGQERGVFLPYREFLEMWNKLNLPEKLKNTEPPVEGVLASASYVGHVEGEVAEIKEALLRGAQGRVVPPQARCGRPEHRGREIHGTAQFFRWRLRSAPALGREIDATLGGLAGKQMADKSAANEPAKAEPQNQVYFNTARGNAQKAVKPAAESPVKPDLNRNQVPPRARRPAQGVPPPAPATTAPAAESAPLGAPPLTAGNRGSNLATSANAVDALLFGTSPVNGRGGPPAQQRLQPEGRISLAVDFPTEGKVWHFKKVKAHAQLALSVTAPESLLRWKWLAAGLAAAGVLALVGRLLERQRARRMVHL
jgi:hypothetical protein